MAVGVPELYPAMAGTAQSIVGGSFTRSVYSSNFKKESPPTIEEKKIAQLSALLDASARGNRALLIFLFVVENRLSVEVRPLLVRAAGNVTR